MPRTLSWAALLTVLGLAVGAHAGDHYPSDHKMKPATPPEQAIPLGSDGYNHTFDRAGNPDCISKCAKPTDVPQFAGYYVGGGCLRNGGPPVPGAQQGTWGWDFVGGCVFRPRVMLGFCYDCKYQGGIGSYRTDGKHIPNVFGIHLPHAEHPEEGHEGHEGHEAHEEGHEAGHEEGHGNGQAKPIAPSPDR
jgi:hypothetical protein